MAYLEELKVLSAVCDNKDVGVLFEAAVDELFADTSDMLDFLKTYYQQNKEIPEHELLKKHYPDFEWQDHGPTRYEIDQLRQASLNEGLSSTLRNSASMLKSGRPKDALNELLLSSSKLTQITEGVRDVDVTDVDSALAHFESVREERDAGVAGIKSGFDGFDVCLPMGINKGQLGVVLAFPARGKSWIMLWLAIQAWKQGRKPLIVSLEMTEREVLNRIYAIISPWSHNQLSAGMVPNEEFQKWAKDALKDKPQFKIISGNVGSEVTPQSIQSKVDQYKPDIVLIDYLQLMTDNARSTGNETVKIKNLSRELKLMAVHDSVPVVAITSATPQPGADMDSVPELGQVAWSKQIAYDSDWVIALGRSEDSTIIECFLRKNRNGYMGGWFIDADFNNGKFKEIEGDGIS